MHTDPEAVEETQERASASAPAAAGAAASAARGDDLAARRVAAARRDNDLPVAAEAAAEDDDDLAVASAVAAAAPQVAADERVSKSGPVLRVSTRTGTEKVSAKKGPSAGLIIAAVAVILLIGGGVVYMLTRGGPETAEVPTPPATEPATPPATETPPVPDQPSTNPGTPDTVAAAAPDAAPAAAAPVEDEVIEMEPDEPAVPVETVQLEVRSVPPGATASLVDGDQSGPTPMKFSLDKSKKHRVRVSHPGFASQEIELDPAKPQVARVTLAPIPWVLKFESTPPNAVIYVDGRRVVGETPNSFQLPAGWEKKKHFKISFRLPHHQKLDLVVDPAFTTEGESMVQTVQGTLVPGEPAPHRPTPARGNQPAPGGGETPPAEGGGTPPPEGGGTPPAEGGGTPPSTPPPAPEGQATEPAPQHS